MPLAPSAVDAQFWNLLAGADMDAPRKHESIGSALKTAGDAGSKSATVGLWQEDIDRIGNRDGVGIGNKLFGVRFSTWGHGIQWENTASAAMAMVRYLQLYKDDEQPMETDVADRVASARDSLKPEKWRWMCRCMVFAMLPANFDSDARAATATATPCKPTK